jgi:hypothetical protein
MLLTKRKKIHRKTLQVVEWDSNKPPNTWEDDDGGGSGGVEKFLETHMACMAYVLNSVTIMVLWLVLLIPFRRSQIGICAQK